MSESSSLPPFAAFVLVGKVIVRCLSLFLSLYVCELPTPTLLWRKRRLRVSPLLLRCWLRILL